MKNEKNIEALKSQLLPLGFALGLERGLRAHICLGPEQFTLHYRCLRQGDGLMVSLPFLKAAGGPDYHCPYYEVRLRRQVDIPPLQLGEVDTADLEARLAAVDWMAPLPARFTEEAPPDPAGGHREEMIERIITDLDRPEASDEGAAVAHLLKTKNWSDTPLEGLIQSAGGQKSRMETAQRFYFFEGERGITLEEAYRYLCHRWRERQWQAQRKGDGTAGGAAHPGGESGTLPPKSRPSKSSKGKG